jgi:hypothetical protein
MTTQDLRQVFKTSRHCQREVRDILQGVFVGELLKPSGELWIVSPWVSDVEIIDNRTGEFSALDPRWTQRQIRLGEVLTALVDRGGRLVLVTRVDERSASLSGLLTDQCRIKAWGDRFRLVERPDLHRKGVLTDGCYLAGSMNLTHNGIAVLDETIWYDTNPERIAKARLDFQKEYGRP